MEEHMRVGRCACGFPDPEAPPRRPSPTKTLDVRRSTSLSVRGPRRRIARVPPMADPRDREYAELIVDGCLDVQPGWQVYVGGNPQARPLLEEVCGAVARRGAYALLRVSFEGFLAQSLSWVVERAGGAAREPAAAHRPRDRDRSTRWSSSRRPTTRARPRRFESERMGALQAAYRPATSRMMNHDIPWVACQYPTAALAQEAGLGTEEFARAPLRRGPARLGGRGRADARDLGALRRRLRGADRRRGHRSPALARGADDEGRRARREPAGRRVLRLPDRGLGGGRDLVRRLPRRLPGPRDHRDPAASSRAAASSTRRPRRTRRT